MFDIGKFLAESAPAALFLVPVVMALVTVLGDTFPQVKGRWQALSSLAAGVFIGTPVFWATSQPVTPGDWVAVILFGLICGLTASGYYNAQRAAALKGSRLASKSPDLQ